MLFIPKVGTTIDGFVIPDGFSQLVTEIEKYLAEYDFINLLIAGATCSGKTSLANYLEKYYSQSYSVVRINQDDYYKDLIEIPRDFNGYAQMDSLYAFSFMEYRNDVKKLLADGMVKVPVYDKCRNKRISKSREVKRGQIQIFEGLHTIRILGDLPVAIKVFLDTDSSLCLKRRIQRDTNQFAVSKRAIVNRWHHGILPMYHQYVLPQKASATIEIKTEEEEKNGAE